MLTDEKQLKEESNIQESNKETSKVENPTNEEEKINDGIKEEKEITKNKKSDNKLVTVKEEKVIKIEEIKKEIKKKKKLPKEEKERINRKVFRNIIVAVVIVAYFIFLSLGKINIKNDVYVTDLKVFSMSILLAAIVIIEIAYKKESGEIAIFGIEMILLSIINMALIYVNLMLSSKYIYVVTGVSLVVALYYILKSAIIYLKNRRKYFVNNMKEIMNKEEVE